MKKDKGLGELVNRGHEIFSKSDGLIVAICRGPRDCYPIIAKELVHRSNCHEDLVEACGMAEEYLYQRNQVEPSDIGEKVRGFVKAAIAKADRGEQEKVR